MALETAAHATPERILRRAVHLVRAGLQRQKIRYHSRRRVLLPQDMIVQGTLIIIGHLGRSLPTKQMAAQLQHIISTTGFARVTADMLGKFVRIEIMFLVAATSGSKGVAAYHRMPEEFAQSLAVSISRQLIITRLSQYFWNECIGMFRPQIIPLFFQRVYYIIMIKETGQPTVTFISRQGIQVVERLVDASELITNHLAARLFRQRPKFPISPVSHFPHHVQCLRIPGIQVLVYQAGKQFVQRVPRCPNTLPPDIPVDELFGISTQITARPRSLYFHQSGHKAVPLHLENIAPRGCIHQSQSRKHVTRRMPAKFTIQGLPSAEFLHRHVSSLTSGKYPCGRPETMQQPIGPDGDHPCRVPHHVVTKTSGQQAHVLQIERFGSQGNLHRDTKLPLTDTGINRLCHSCSHAHSPKQADNYSLLHVFLSYCNFIVYSSK